MGPPPRNLGEEGKIFLGAPPPDPDVVINRARILPPLEKIDDRPWADISEDIDEKS